MLSFTYNPLKIKSWGVAKHLFGTLCLPTGPLCAVHILQSVWYKGKLKGALLLCMWSCIKLCNLAVQCSGMIFNVGCSEFRNANLQFQKRNVCMQCVCLYLYVNDQILCIVKVCVSQLFWSREVTHNTEVAALHCGGYEAICASQYLIIYESACRQPDFRFLVITGQISYVFLFLWGGKSALLML